MWGSKQYFFLSIHCTRAARAYTPAEGCTTSKKKDRDGFSFDLPPNRQSNPPNEPAIQRSHLPKRGHPPQWRTRRRRLRFSIGLAPFHHSWSTARPEQLSHYNQRLGSSEHASSAHSSKPLETSVKMAAPTVKRSFRFVSTDAKGCTGSKLPVNTDEGLSRPHSVVHFDIFRRDYRVD